MYEAQTINKETFSKEVCGMDGHWSRTPVCTYNTVVYRFECRLQFDSSLFCPANISNLQNCLLKQKRLTPNQIYTFRGLNLLFNKKKKAVGSFWK